MTQQVFIVEYGNVMCGDQYESSENTMVFADYEGAERYLIDQGFIQNKTGDSFFSKCVDEDIYYTVEGFDNIIQYRKGEQIERGSIESYPVMQSNRVLCGSEINE